MSQFSLRLLSNVISSKSTQVICFNEKRLKKGILVSAPSASGKTHFVKHNELIGERKCVDGDDIIKRTLYDHVWNDALSDKDTSVIFRWFESLIILRHLVATTDIVFFNGSFLRPDFSIVIDRAQHILQAQPRFGLRWPHDEKELDTDRSYVQEKAHLYRTRVLSSFDALANAIDRGVVNNVSLMVDESYAKRSIQGVKAHSDYEIAILLKVHSLCSFLLRGMTDSAKLVGTLMKIVPELLVYEQSMDILRAANKLAIDFVDARSRFIATSLTRDRARMVMYNHDESIMPLVRRLGCNVIDLLEVELYIQMLFYRRFRRGTITISEYDHGIGYTMVNRQRLNNGRVLPHEFNLIDDAYTFITADNQANRGNKPVTIYPSVVGVGDMYFTTHDDYRRDSCESYLLQINAFKNEVFGVPERTYDQTNVTLRKEVIAPDPVIRSRIASYLFTTQLLQFPSLTFSGKFGMSMTDSASAFGFLLRYTAINALKRENLNSNVVFLGSEHESVEAAYQNDLDAIHFGKGLNTPFKPSVDAFTESTERYYSGNMNKNGIYTSAFPLLALRRPLWIIHSKASVEDIPGFTKHRAIGVRQFDIDDVDASLLTEFARVVRPTLLIIDLPLDHLLFTMCEVSFHSCVINGTVYNGKSYGTAWVDKLCYAVSSYDLTSKNNILLDQQMHVLETVHCAQQSKRLAVLYVRKDDFFTEKHTYSAVVSLFAISNTLNSFDSAYHLMHSSQRVLLCLPNHISSYYNGNIPFKFDNMGGNDIIIDKTHGLTSDYLYKYAEFKHVYDLRDLMHLYPAQLPNMNGRTFYFFLWPLITNFSLVERDFQLASNSPTIFQRVVSLTMRTSFGYTDSSLLIDRRRWLMKTYGSRFVPATGSIELGTLDGVEFILSGHLINIILSALIRVVDIRFYIRTIYVNYLLRKGVSSVQQKYSKLSDQVVERTPSDRWHTHRSYIITIKYLRDLLPRLGLSILLPLVEVAENEINQLPKNL